MSESKNEKIIDFKEQQRHNNMLEDSFHKNLENINENTIHFSVAFKARNITDDSYPRANFVDFEAETFVSFIHNDKYDSKDKIFIRTPDVNILEKEDVFIYQEALSKSIELQYDTLYGEGAYQKDLVKYKSDLKNGNLFNNTDVINFNLFKDFIDRINKGSEDEIVNNQINQIINFLPKSIRLLFYSSEYVGSFRDSIKKLNSESAKSLVSYTMNKENILNSFYKYEQIKPKDLNNTDSKSDQKSDKINDFISKILKNNSIMKGAVEKDFSDKNESLSYDEIDNLMNSYYLEDSLMYKQYMNLLDKKLKGDLKLKELDYSITLNKIEELKRITCIAERYVESIEKGLNHKIKINEEKGIIEEAKSDIELEREYVNFLREDIKKTNKKCLDSILNGSDYIDNKDERRSKINIDEMISDDIPEGLKKILGDISSKAINKLDEPCDCVNCFYIEQTKKLVNI